MDKIKTAKNKYRNIEFWSKDKKYGVKIFSVVLHNLLSLCKLSKNKETGGLLFGYYSDNYFCANITAFADAPKDSVKKYFTFFRGVNGLQQVIDKLWKRDKTYYLGEWHYHPCKKIAISKTDIQQMKEISMSKKYKCPEPVCIIAGIEKNKFPNINCYVFPRNKNTIRLKLY